MQTKLPNKRWMFVGTGNISNTMYQTMARLSQTVVSIFSRKVETAIEFANNKDIAVSTDSFDEAIKNVDVVYIATPNTFHYEFAKKAIAAGKDVVCEKVLTESYSKTQELFELAKTKNVVLMEGVANIAYPELKGISGTELRTNYMQLSSQIKKGTVSTASSFDKAKFGGVIPDLGIYTISAAVMILGNILSWEMSGIKRINGVESEVAIKLKHEKGSSSFTISKEADGDNRVYLDGREVAESINFVEDDNRLDNEIKDYLMKTDIDVKRRITLESIRVIEEMKKSLDN